MEQILEHAPCVVNLAWVRKRRVHGSDELDTPELEGGCREVTCFHYSIWLFKRES